MANPDLRHAFESLKAAATRLAGGLTDLSQHFLNEQEHVVGPAIAQAVAAFDWPMLRFIALRPAIRFAFFPGRKCFWFRNFAARKSASRKAWRRLKSPRRRDGHRSSRPSPAVESFPKRFSPDRWSISPLFVLACGSHWSSPFRLIRRGSAAESQVEASHIQRAGWGILRTAAVFPAAFSFLTGFLTSSRSSFSSSSHIHPAGLLRIAIFHGFKCLPGDSLETSALRRLHYRPSVATNVCRSLFLVTFS